MAGPDHDQRAPGKRVAVVGSCGSGKTTIVRELLSRGVRAYAVSQEHSIVPDLWQHQRPDAVVFLDASLETIRARRGGDWPAWLFDLQHRRLAHARANATLVVDTGELSVVETVERVLAALEATDESGEL